MKGNILTSVLIIVVIFVVGWIFRPKTPVVPQPVVSVAATSTSPSALIHGKVLHLIVVDTPATREVGLGGRASLPEDTGMLFVFDMPGKYEFWMKDMKIPIDIIWLDVDFRIVHIEHNVSPDTYPDVTFAPEENSLYVLETNAGFAEKNNLSVGENVKIDLKK